MQLELAEINKPSWDFFWYFHYLSYTNQSVAESCFGSFHDLQYRWDYSGHSADNIEAPTEAQNADREKDSSSESTLINANQGAQNRTGPAEDSGDGTRRRRDHEEPGEGERGPGGERTMRNQERRRDDHEGTRTGGERTRRRQDQAEDAGDRTRRK